MVEQFKQTCSSCGYPAEAGHSKECKLNSPVEADGTDQDEKGSLADRPDFVDFIPLNQDMAPAEALGWLYKYFPDTKPGVLEKEFPELNNSVGLVSFKKPTLQRHGGSIEMIGKKPDGESWYHLLGATSGIKQAKIG